MGVQRFNVNPNIKVLMEARFKTVCRVGRHFNLNRLRHCAINLNVVAAPNAEKRLIFLPPVEALSVEQSVFKVKF
jgi:hypothetical protein